MGGQGGYLKESSCLGQEHSSNKRIDTNILVNFRWRKYSWKLMANDKLIKAYQSELTLN